MGQKGTKEGTTTVADGKISVPEEKKKSSSILPIALGVGGLLVIGVILFMVFKKNKDKKEKEES